GVGRMIGNRPVVDKLVRCRIEATQAVLLANPYTAASIWINGDNVVRTQAVGIIRAVPVALEMSGALIESNKTAASATNPEITCGIFVNATNISASTDHAL